MTFLQNHAVNSKLGFQAGMFSVSSDVSAKLPTVGVSVHVRKALGYVFSLRLQYVYGGAKGLTGNLLRL